MRAVHRCKSCFFFMSSLSGKQHVCATIPENVLKYRFFAVMCDIFPENMPTFVRLLPSSKDKSNAIKKNNKNTRQAETKGKL